MFTRKSLSQTYDVNLFTLLLLYINPYPANVENMVSF